MQLVRFDNDGIELIINTQTGEAFASQAGYARMSGVNYSTIRKRIERLNAVTNNSLKQAQIDTPQGLRLVTLVTEDLICEWLTQDNPTMATQLLKLGVRMFLHNLAGYKVQSTAITEPTNAEIMNAIVKLQADVTELKETKRKYDNIKDNVSIRFANFALTLSRIEEEPIDPNTLPENEDTIGGISLKDWLWQHKKIKWDAGEMRKFGRFVSSTYQALTGKEPKKKSECSTVCVYSDNDEEILLCCLRHYLRLV